MYFDGFVFVAKCSKMLQRLGGIMAKKSELSDQQKRAIQLIVSGQSSFDEIAKEVGIDRQTLLRWRKENSLFVAELNIARNALAKKYQARLDALVTKSLEVLEQNMDAKIAWEVLKHFQDRIKDGGSLPEKPEDIESDWQFEKRMKDSSREFEKSLYA